MQILRKNGLLKGNKTFGTVIRQLNSTVVEVEMVDSSSIQRVNCSPNLEFNTGDRVLIEYINNNPHDMFIMGLIKGGQKIPPDEPLDYFSLPYEPVEIFRNEADKAYRFMYGYDNPKTTWYQELIRDESGRVVEIIHEYPDGFVLIRTLFRNEKEQVYKYE